MKLPHIIPRALVILCEIEEIRSSSFTPAGGLANGPEPHRDVQA